MCAVPVLKIRNKGNSYFYRLNTFITLKLIVKFSLIMKNMLHRDLEFRSGANNSQISAPISLMIFVHGYLQPLPMIAETYPVVKQVLRENRQIKVKKMSNVLGILWKCAFHFSQTLAISRACSR